MTRKAPELDYAALACAYDLPGVDLVHLRNEGVVNDRLESSEAEA